MLAREMELGDSVEDPLIGRTLSSRYLVRKKLGEGGMGAVYEAEHTLIKKRVAVKVLHPEYSQNAEVVGRFHREALAATGIGNEHIVEVNDMGRLDDGGLYMVLELLDGRDFAALLAAEGRLSVGRTVRIVRQMCDGLRAAHEKGIVHRDLKPENVFLITRHGDPEFVKILDFGISKIMASDAGDAPTSSTKTGMIIGTALYMPPEQARGSKDVDHRADVYALGVILYRALSGEYPFQAESYVDLVVKLCTEEAIPLVEHRPDLPAGLLAVIARCLSKDPAARYASCTELSTALAPFEAIDAAPPVREAQTIDVAAATLHAPATPSTRDVRTADPRTSGPAVATPAPTIEAPTTLPNERARSLPIPAIAIGLSLVVALGAWALTRTEDAPVEAPIAIPTPPHVDPVAPADPVDPPEPALPPAPAPAVAIHITTAPVSDAELFLDGAPIANPFQASLPASAALHSLEVRAPGYRTFLRDISLAYPQDIAITLHRGRGVEDRRTGPAVHASDPPSDPAATEPPVAPADPPPVAEPEPTPEPEPLIVVPPPPHALKHLTSHLVPSEGEP